MPPSASPETASRRWRRAAIPSASMGGMCAGRVLATGDEIGIGGHRLSVAEGQPGFDLTLEVRRDESVSDSEFEGAFRTDLRHTWLSKRSAAWLLAGSHSHDRSRDTRCLDLHGAGNAQPAFALAADGCGVDQRSLVAGSRTGDWEGMRCVPPGVVHSRPRRSMPRVPPAAGRSHRRNADRSDPVRLAR